VPAAVNSSRRQEVVSLSRTLLGKKEVILSGHIYGHDCTALVQALFDHVGISLLSNAHGGDNGVAAMYRYAQAHGRLYTKGRPSPGDLVFFKDTYDQNHDGRVNDGLTHVGLVEAVDASGTVSVIHRVHSGVVRYRMNLEHPGERLDGHSGLVLNDYLRAPERPHGLTLTGELFAAYGAVLPLEATDVGDDHLPVLRPQPAGGSI
jgi:hypothetical protein